MPRITGANIAEHVAQQEAAVLDSARRLFAERGVNGVSLADIAADVGLQRTSLYRYFPTKGHILLRWFEAEMEPLLTQAKQIVARSGSAADRLEDWVDLQLDFLTDGGHRALVEVATGSDVLPDEVRARFGERHRQLYATLAPLLPEDPELRSMFVAGLVRSAGELVGRGVALEAVRRELRRSARAVAGL